MSEFVKLVDTSDDKGTLTRVIVPKSTNLIIYDALYEYNILDYNQEKVNNVLNNNVLSLEDHVYEEYKNLLIKYDDSNELKLYTLKLENNEEFIKVNNNSNSKEILKYFESFMTNLITLPNTESKIAYEEMNKRIAKKISNELNLDFQNTFISLGPGRKREAIIPPFVIDKVTLGSKFNIILLDPSETLEESNSMREANDMMNFIKDWNNDIVHNLNILLFHGRVHLPSLTDSKLTRTDFVESFIKELSIDFNNTFMYWGEYACGNIKEYLSDAKITSSLGVTVLGTDVLIKNSNVCTVTQGYSLIDSGNKYSVGNNSLYPLKISFTGEFVEHLSKLLNKSNADVNVPLEWKNSLDIIVQHEETEKDKDLSVSDAMRTEGNNTDDQMSDDDEGSIVETVSVNHQSGGSKISTYKKTIKELYHKYSKYKYKHEMQKRKIKEVLKKHNMMELYEEIMTID